MIRLPAVLAAGAILAFLTAGNGRACVIDMGVNPDTPQAGLLFPNWKQVLLSVFDTEWCDAVTCLDYSDATVNGLTLMNFGTASGGPGGDITTLYVCFDCGTANACTPASPTAIVMTYVGIWVVDGFSRPTWTWSGVLPLSADPCASCGCYHAMSVFADIGSCPANGATVRIGVGYNPVNNPIQPGGLMDSENCDVPYTDVDDPNDKTIGYVAKETDSDLLAPGDTATYTIYYGLPGSGSISSITITDTLPPYTHYVVGSASPSADASWAPDPGPPARLRWTMPGPIPVAEGGTRAIVFQLTVDWGNGEGFEPGSGDVAAPEGVRLDNRAHAFFEGVACPYAISLPVNSVVRRFLFWKTGDNDLLFASQPGRPPDEMIYEIMLKNVSTEKTWWNVNVWDTVPPELDPWGADSGLNDPFLGWTMTPSGAAPASAGWILSGTDTVLTWKLDLPPGGTISLRWKAKIRASVPPGATAVNEASVRAFGWTGVVDGTGDSLVPRRFAHQAPVVLPTTYISYVGFAADDNDKEGCPGFFISFFPPNKGTNFELRGIEYRGPGWAMTGGASESIGCFLGACISGFPGSPGCTLGSGAISGGGIAGCKSERSAATYDPVDWHMFCPTYPLNFIYKVVSNTPLLWQLLTHMSHDAQDNHTYAPSTTLSYRGLMHYMWRRGGMDTGTGDGDSLGLINTGLDPDGVLRPNLATTVHLFKWDYPTLSWVYMKTYELAPESLALDLGPLLVDEGPWRTMSSDTQLIVYQGNDTISTLFSSGCGDNFGTFMPTRETGNVVSRVGSGTFYGGVPGYSEARKIVIGNLGVADATYKIARYIPDSPVAAGMIPALLNGTSGSWTPVGMDWVPAGLATTGNPHTYGAAFNAVSFAMYRIELIEGGPIQIQAGVRVQTTWAGGAVMHAADGDQTGEEYWFPRVSGDNLCKDVFGVQAINVFCPKTGMAVRAVTGDGYDSTYTTTGPDQCISFLALTEPAFGVTRNYKFNVLPGPPTGDVIAQYYMCKITEKGYTAPFLQTGVHYTIIAPPFVYVDQDFWITVVVVDNTQTTKTDYDGATSFTSTDPRAEVQSTPMETYNYDWSGAEGGVKLFVNVRMSQLGLQSLVATDTVDGSIAGLATIMVIGVDVKLTKEPRFSTAASGDIVQFRICWSNYSSASASNFIVTDAVPNGMTYLTSPIQTRADHFCGATGGFTSAMVAYSTTDNSPASYADVPVGGTTAAVKWLRWTIPSEVGVRTTGCVCFKVRVN